MHAASAAKRWGALTFRARLMITIITIVSVILIVISSLMSVVLANVLRDQLSDRVVNEARTVGRDLLRDLDFGASLQEVVAGRPVQAGSLIITIDSRDSVEGVTVEGNQVKTLTSEQLQTADVRQSGGPAGAAETLTIDGVGEFRVRAVDAGGTTLILGISTSEVTSLIGYLLTTILLATLGGLLILSAAVTLVVRAGLRPLVVVADTATRVAEQPLDQGAVAITERVDQKYTDAHTEIGQVGLALNTLLDHVESSLEARQRNEELMRRFVADASHELRTPLASIRGYSELSLRDAALTENSRQALDRIQAQSVRMTELVEDLLLLARLDEGQVIAVGVVDLTQVSVEAVADQQAVSGDYAWSVDVPDEPVVIAADQGRITQLIVNLLANARTHTPPGTEITLALRVDGSGSASTAVLSVVDTGPGIASEFTAKLFTRFARSDDSRARKTGGSGLGLSIVKAIVDAHHGRIAVRSEPGNTVFEVRLPARPM